MNAMLKLKWTYRKRTCIDGTYDYYGSAIFTCIRNLLHLAKSSESQMVCCVAWFVVAVSLSLPLFRMMDDLFCFYAISAIVLFLG